MIGVIVSVAGVAAVLAVFVVIMRSMRARMRRGRFHGIESSIGGSAYMGAPTAPVTAPPDRLDPNEDTNQRRS